MSDQGKIPTFEGLELISDGWLKKYILSYRMPDGGLYQYESISRKGPKEYERVLLDNGQGIKSAADAVCIVPVLENGSLLMIREFRYSVNAWVIAFPAGLIEPGESIEDCVNRELSEETGYCLADEGPDDKPRVHAISKAGYSTVGMSEESVQVVVAHVKRHGQPHCEPNEFIETFELAIENAQEYLAKSNDLIGTRAQLILEMASGSLL